MFQNLAALAATLLALTTNAAAQVVPAPKQLKLGQQRVVAPLILCEPQFGAQVEAFQEELRALGAERTNLGIPESELVFLSAGAELADNGSEAYTIRSSASRIEVRANDPIGVARATATLVQLASVENGVLSFPAIDVDDSPDSEFRCAMVDLGRNPISPSALRRLIDAMWFYKANYLQLHLTDDQLFSWPSRAYPELLSENAGWTWDDFVELESYSQARGVTLIPELEVPGHSGILRGKVPEVFGKTATELATTDVARRGIRTLLDEMLSVFRATPYVHIGGDEAFGVPEEVQRDLINDLSLYLESKGKRAIVWEGPRLGEGDNKVREEVLHINWRTINFPAQAMLDAGYEVVNAAWDPLYIVDHYPRTMFTAVDLERCYDLDLTRFAHVNHGIPTFAKPHRTRSAEGIVGFCMPYWEGREENLIPLLVPRLAAACAATWNREGEEEFSDFDARRLRQRTRLETISGIAPNEIPYADPATQGENLAYRGSVTVSAGAAQPCFGPERLTNGIPDRFDHFLGFPTVPEALEITIELTRPAEIGRIVVHERAVGGSHELYEVYVRGTSGDFVRVGETQKDSRGEASFVEHRFDAREVAAIRIVTRGCHGLTFPSFSRLSEVMAFAN